MPRRGRSTGGGSRGRSISRGRSFSRGRSISRGRSFSRGRSSFRARSSSRGRSPIRFGSRARRNITRHFRRRYPQRPYRPRYYRGYRRRPTYYYSAYPYAYYSSAAYAPYYYYTNPYFAYYDDTPYLYASGVDYTAPDDVNQVHIGTARNAEVWLSQPNTAIYQRDQASDPVFMYCERGRPVLAEPGSGTVQRPLLPVDGFYYQCSAN